MDQGVVPGVVRIERWRFHRGDVPEAHRTAFDDSAWREVDLPHDWSIEDVPGTTSPFSATESGGKGATGHAVGGVGWYRTTLHTPMVAGAQRRLVFEGSYGRTEVWVNGHLMTKHWYGYTPFEVDLGSAMLPGETQVVAVRVENPGHNARWYSGSGLYRRVRLHTAGRVMFATDSLTVRTTTLDDSMAAIDATVGAELGDHEHHRVEYRWRVVGPDGDEQSTRVTLDPDCRFEIAQPQRWWPWTHDPQSRREQPLYRLEVEVLVDGEPSDQATTTFGLRTVEYDPDGGLHVNGVHVLLQGGCFHHDHGPLGAASYDRAEERKVELHREAGFNAFRTSHNPPATGFLDACDRLGMMVLDEVHDEWEDAKCADGYAQVFLEFGEADAQAMVRRDRNHPSVWCWSIGNEIINCFQQPHTALALRNAILAEDPTRPIAAGLCAPWWKDESWVDWVTSAEPGHRHLDISGMNYQWAQVRPDHEANPRRMVMQTETFALHAWDSWQSVVECPWNFGDFVWTSQDYIGESGIGQYQVWPGEPVNGDYPFHLAVCGDLDLLGERKPQSFYRESLWRPGVLRVAVHVPDPEGRRSKSDIWHHQWGWDDVRSHWTWPGCEGASLQVELYTSCDEVRLWRNGQDVGHARLSPADRNRARFDVAYEPGELLAVGYLAGREVARHRLQTTGTPVRVVASADGPVAGELAYVHIQVVDDCAVRLPESDAEVVVRVDGPGRLLALGNASPIDVDSVQDGRHRLWRGAALAVVRPTGPGEVQVIVESPGLLPGTARFTAG